MTEDMYEAITDTCYNDQRRKILNERLRIETTPKSVVIYYHERYITTLFFNEGTYINKCKMYVIFNLLEEIYDD